MDPAWRQRGRGRGQGRGQITANPSTARPPGAVGSEVRGTGELKGSVTSRRVTRCSLRSDAALIGVSVSLQGRLSPGSRRSGSLTGRPPSDWPQSRTALPLRMRMTLVKMEGSGGRFSSRLSLRTALTQVLTSHSCHAHT